MKWGKKNKIIERDMIKRNRFEKEKLRCSKKKKRRKRKNRKKKNRYVIVLLVMYRRYFDTSRFAQIKCHIRYRLNKIIFMNAAQQREREKV